MKQIKPSVPTDRLPILIHCGLAMPYDKTAVAQTLAQIMACCLMAPMLDYGYSALLSSSMEFCVTYLLTTILQKALTISIHKMSLEITLLKLQPHIPEATELIIFASPWAPCQSNDIVVTDTQSHKVQNN